MNKKYCAIAIIGLMTSFAYAEEPSHSRADIFEYRCSLETCSTDHACPGDHKCEHEGTECWVEGTVCQEDSDHHAEGGRGCERKDDTLRIKCNNGFKLTDNDAATTTEDYTLWVNGEEDEKIATLRVEDFVKSAKRDNKFRLEADLLISKKRHSAQRLAGRCEFQKKEYH